MKGNSICRDNRFEIIEKAKEKLLNATNIEDSKEEMKVLTNILFRMWQAGLINEEKLEINKLQKENSIEEDIELLQDETSSLGLFFKCKCSEKYKIALEHILSDYKRVLKENEELKNEVMEKDLEIIGKEEYTKASMKEIIEQYYTANEECISKQRIEDIIDRINYDIKKTKEIISKNTNIYTSYGKNDYQIVRLRAMNTKSLDIKKRLQELLESEE